MNKKDLEFENYKNEEEEFLKKHRAIIEEIKAENNKKVNPIKVIAAVIFFALIVFFGFKPFINGCSRYIDHALDIDTICADCSSTVDFCKEYWETNHKCGK